MGRSRKVLLQIPVEVEPEEGEGEELVAEGAEAFVPQHRLEKEVLGGVSQEQLVVPQLRLLLRTTPRAQNVPAKRKTRKRTSLLKNRIKQLLLLLVFFFLTCGESCAWCRPGA